MPILIRTRIDFLRYRYLLIAMSGSIILAGLIYILAPGGGFTYGLDFSGGTLVRVAFAEPRADDSLRKVVSDAGFPNPMIQTLKGAVQETLIRVESSGQEEEAKTLRQGERDVTISTKIVAALGSEADKAALAKGKLDINSAGQSTIAAKLKEWDPADPKSDEIAAAIAEAKKGNHGLIVSPEMLGKVPGMTDKVKAALLDKGFLSSSAVLEVGYVGPQVGHDLRQKAIAATVFSLLGILFYIYLRFELDFGVAAIIATVHDLLITLGLVALLRIEFDLTLVAAVLTIAGYSVNDTIVIFDRIRENLRLHRRADFIDLCNYSVNQTLSRTILTSMTTAFVVICLSILGGQVTRGFAVTMLLGIVIGTYSSIYVASPAIILWREVAARRRAAQTVKV